MNDGIVEIDRVDTRAGSQSLAETPVRVSCEPEFDFGSAEYRSLFDGSDATPFQHPLWLGSFSNHLVKPRGAALMPITGRHPQSGNLLFVLPMILRNKAGVTLLESCDLGVSDYAAPVVDACFRPHDVSALREIVKAALPRHDLLRVQPVRHEHVVAWNMFLDARAEPLSFSAHSVALPTKTQRWHGEVLSEGFAKTLTRKARKFAKEPTGRLERVLPGKPASDAIAALARLRNGRFENDLIQQDFVEAFYAEIAAQGARQDFAHCFRAEIAGEAIGYCFGLSHRGRFYYLLIGCDYDRFGRYSPGLILYEHMISDCVANGYVAFDFTIGDEAFKMKFGTRPTPMFGLCAARSWRGKLALAAMQMKGGFRAGK